MYIIENILLKNFILLKCTKEREKKGILIVKEEQPVGEIEFHNLYFFLLLKQKLNSPATSKLKENAIFLVRKKRKYPAFLR